MLTSAQNESFQTTQTGFSVTRQGSRREFLDGDVLGLRVDTRRESDLIGGLSVLQSLQLRVRDDDGDDWVTLAHEVGPFDEDRLAGLRERLLDELFERACDRLSLGEEVQGDGWTLSLAGFTDHASGATCYPQQISAATWEADELCLWHEDESQPFARYPRSGENSLVLYRLLGQFLDHDFAAGTQAFGVGLGKRLGQFTTYHRHTLPVRRIAIQMSLMLAGLMCCMSLYTLGVGLVLIMVVVVSALPLLRGYTETLKHFERGLVWSSGTDERVLLFDQLAAFSVDWQQSCVDVRRDLRRVVMQFYPEDPEQAAIDMEIQYDAAGRAEAESIQTHASAAVAARMQRDLVRRGRVAWTSRVAILRNGLEDHKTPAGPIQLLTFDEIERWQLTPQQLTLQLKEGRSPIIYATNQPNFYAGWMLLQMQGLVGKECA